MKDKIQYPAEGDDMLEPLIYAAIMHNGKPKTVADFERAAAGVADMLKRRANPQPKGMTDIQRRVIEHYRFGQFAADMVTMPEWLRQDLCRMLDELAQAPAVEHLIPQGFRVEHCAPWGALTDEANARTAWLVERTEAPYSGLDRQRKWSGPTLADAMRAARESLPADIFNVPVQGSGS